jgi:hypothetical protein
MVLSEDGMWPTPADAVDAAKRLHSELMEAARGSSTATQFANALEGVGHVRVPTRSISNAVIDFSVSVDDAPEPNAYNKIALVIIRAVIKPLEQDKTPTLADTLSQEMNEWIRIIFGDSWYDYAYRVDASRSLVRLAPIFYAVFISLENRGPELAHPRFDWSVVNGRSGPANRFKLRPKGANVELNSHLLRFGDTRTIDTETVSTNPDHAWWMTTASRLLTLIARRVQQNPIDQLEVATIALDANNASIIWRRRGLPGVKNSTREEKVLNLDLHGFHRYLGEFYEDSSSDRAAATLLNAIVHPEEFHMPAAVAQIQQV